MRNVPNLFRSLRIPLVTLVLGAAVYLAPSMVQNAYASGAECSVECRGGSCSAAGPTCTCTCSFWLGVPQCNCSEQVAPPAGGG